jgi:NADPH:quinone reductase-like Zn-dependent oxidoreductase
MKAAVRRKYGSAETLRVEELKKPHPKAMEVLVRVHATTVNRTDCAVLSGKPYVMRLFTGLFSPRNIIPGTDFAGEVEAVGKEVKSFAIGDKVFGFKDDGLGSQTTYLTISEAGNITTFPDNVSFRQAAASLEGAHYAYNFLKKCKLQEGHHVLINGATGAIGSALIQLAKLQQVQVTAVCQKQYADRIKQLGADRIIDYTEEDFTKDTQRYHYVFDAVGKSTFSQCKPALQPGGYYISSELGREDKTFIYPLLQA